MYETGDLLHFGMNRQLLRLFAKIFENHGCEFFSICIERDFRGDRVFPFLGVVEVSHHASVAEAAGDVDIYMGISKLGDDGGIDEVGNGEGIVDGGAVIVVAVEDGGGDGARCVTEIVIVVGYVVYFEIVDAELHEVGGDFRFRRAKCREFFIFFFRNAGPPGGVEGEDHLGNAGIHNDFCRFRVSVEIEFCRGTGVGTGMRTAHDDQFFDLILDARFDTECHGDIRERADSGNGNITVRLHELFHKVKDGVFRLGCDRGFRHGEKITVAVVPGDAGKFRLPLWNLVADDRFFAAPVYRDIRMHELDHAERIFRGLWHNTVAVDCCEREEIDFLCIEGKHNGNGVIRAGIAVEDQFLFHHLGGSFRK